MPTDIEAVAFDCFGTLIDFGDEAFAEAYGLICAEQSIPIDGKTFYDKWMEIWRRLIAPPPGSGALANAAQVAPFSPSPKSERGLGGEVSPTGEVNSPAPLSAADAIPGHPEHHAPSAGRSRALDGPLGPFRTYREEWTEHFALCFEELGVTGDAPAAHERLRELLCRARAFPEARRVVEHISRRLPVAVLSNADDDFLHPPLHLNGLAFPVVISSETARAYKPHVAIFHVLSDAMGLPPENILYVGDSRLADVTGARHAGLKAAWVNRKRTTEWSATGRTLLDPDYEVETLEPLLDILHL